MKKGLFFCLFMASYVGLIAQDKYELYQNLAENASKLKGLAAGCMVGQSQTQMDLNNVRMDLRLDGILWTSDGGRSAGYEIPKGSGKTNIWAGGLWISGVDLYGVRKQCAVKFIGSRNYYPGPLKTSGNEQGTTTIDACYEDDRLFEINRFEVDDFRNWHKQTSAGNKTSAHPYTIPESILNWPAHANAAAGYDYHLAPFYDQNEDGHYNPMDGDYPFYDLDQRLPCSYTRENRVPHLRGDQTTWWVMNDAGNIHYSPGGESIGLEIRAQAYQYSTADEINDMSFYSYELINRSPYTLIDTHIGLYVDGDLGYGFDDFTGCDVGRGLGYFYNGDDQDGDGEAWAYGAYPPAIGFDFFEGPYKTANGQDDCTAYDENKQLICNDCSLNGSINGLNFGDQIVDNERLGMTHVMIYSTYGGVGPQPWDDEIYELLRALWKDETHLRYFGNGHLAGGGTGPETNFFYPGKSDPCGWGQNGMVMPEWSEETENNTPADRRMVMSSGPFIMEPGSVNDFTFGAVWAQSPLGDRMASVDEMLLADDKAQQLFENCFRITDGPDAPDLTIIPGDQKLTVHIHNAPGSNNYLEGYHERDPFIVCPSDVPDCDLYYSFQGYQVWQLRDYTVNVQDAMNGKTDKARLVFQCDIRDGVSEIINYTWDPQLRGTVPKLMVKGANQGIQHSFQIENDLFSISETRLVNYKDYYFVAVAYAYNNYKDYEENNPWALDGQKQAYKASRKGASGPIQVYAVQPHKRDYADTGSLWYTDYGTTLPVTMVEGHGNGGNVLDLDEETIGLIMEGPPWKAMTRKYKTGLSPLKVEVIDPLNLGHSIGNFTLQFDSVDYFDGPGKINGVITDANWFIVHNQTDTIWSEQMIHRFNQQLIPEMGIAISVGQVASPFRPGAVNNGFLEATIEFKNPSEPWLTFVADDDRFHPNQNPCDWIRSGIVPGDYDGDENEVFETVLEGMWAPYKQAYIGPHGPADSDARYFINTKEDRLASVDLFITMDRSKWTRSPVVETCDDDALSIGMVGKFLLRAEQSIDKYGHQAEPGSGADSLNMDAPNYISETGMGWFPGYAIDVETGERLNIVYGESSWLTGDNGADMMWNPSTRRGSKLFEALDGLAREGVYFAGKHFIYIMGHNNNGSRHDLTWFPAYDAGQYFMESIQNKRDRYRIRHLFSNAMWTSIPMLEEDFFDQESIENDPYGFIVNDVHIRLRVAAPYRIGVNEFGTPDSVSLNQNKPMFRFTTEDLIRFGSHKPDTETLLSRIQVVPNPWYANGYQHPEASEEYVKIINLPDECTISIYTLNGNLVRRIQKNDQTGYAEWDIRNSSGIPISGGIYIFHINCPGIGERIIKWFGAAK